MRTEPPPPTKMPRWPSGRAKNAVSSATRIWTAEASSSPPPITAPLSAATHGIGPRGGGLRVHHPGRRLGQVEAGREIGAVAEDHAALGLVGGAVHGVPDLLD